MKKFLSCFLFVILSTFAIANAKDIVPVRPIISQANTIGMYQVGDDITIYKDPDENSQILYRVRWNYDEFFPENIGFDKFFAVFLPKKNLALINVVDVDEEWLEIIYDNTKNKSGWIKKDDPYKFMTWINFYNVYGKKYGLSMLNGTPEKYKDIKASTDDNAQTVSTINVPQKINLSVLRGNWALVSVMDLDRTPKTGYIRWRSDDGVKYFFPQLK